MTKSGLVLRLTNNMNRHDRPADEIEFERANIASWFDTCKNASNETLRAMGAHVATCLDVAINRGDTAYYDTRAIFLEVVDHFLPAETDDIPY